tara:strand:- start:2411 stop:2572 length:162 start_codon:yes stop_codon:yes gene_type:complete
MTDLQKKNEALKMIINGLIKGSEILIDDLNVVDSDMLIDFKEMLNMARASIDT